MIRFSYKSRASLLSSVSAKTMLARLLAARYKEGIAIAASIAL
jgi:hypothetical protein